MTLTDFLLARIAEDEAATKTPATFPGDTHELWICDEYGHVAADPARVLAECEAKRRIVEAMSAPENLVTEDARRVAAIARQVVLGNLAVPYADHPDYREEWRP